MIRSAPLRPALLLAAAASAVAVAGCHEHGRDSAVAITTKLVCPEEQGDLHRTDAAPDGRSCRYAGPDGQEVTLAYLALDGRSPQDALKPTEAALRADVPAAASNEPGSLRPADEDASVPDRRGDDHASWSKGRDDGDDDRDDDGDDDRTSSSTSTSSSSSSSSSSGAPPPPRPPEPPQVDSSWTSSNAHGEGSHDRVHINLPFLHVDADGTGRAHVRTFGVDVNADGDDHRAMVRTPGGGAIDAHDGGAEMRFGSVGRRRADLVYIVASDHAGPQGFRSGAYVAKGPADGPLVLAVVRSRHDSEGHHDGDLHDVKRLVNHNVRGGDRGFNIDIDD